MPTIVIADDRVMLCEGLAAALREHPLVHVQGLAHTDEDAVRLAHQTRPDLLVVDISLPRATACGVVERLARNHVRVALLLMAEERDTAAVCAVMRGGRGGGRGVIHRARPIRDLVTAIGIVAARGVFCDPSFAAAHDAAWNYDPLKGLTPREHSILALIAQGHSSKDIGSILRVSPRTVDHARERIKAKLGMERTAELVRFAVRHGVVSN